MNRYVVDRVRMEATARTVPAVFAWHLLVNALIPGIGFDRDLIPFSLFTAAVVIVGAAFRSRRVCAAGTFLYILWLSVKVVQFWAEEPKASILYVGFIVFASVWAAVILNEARAEHE